MKFDLRGNAGLIVMVAITAALIWRLTLIGADGQEPTDGEVIFAWIARGIVALVCSILGALGLVGAVRRSPMQEWMCPWWDDLCLAAEALKTRLEEGDLTQADAVLAAGLAVGGGVTLHGVLQFASALLQRF